MGIVRNFLLLIVATSTLMGCSSMIDKQRVDKVNSVAVVGFSVFQGADNAYEFTDAINGTATGTHQLATDFYTVFSNSYAKTLNVKVLTVDEVRADQYYQYLWAKYSSSEKLLLAMGTRYRSPSVLTGQALFEMTADEKTQLAKSLKVDSIIGFEAMLYRGSKSSSSVGSGGLGVSDISFKVTISDYEQYDKNAQKPIVAFTNFVGGIPDVSYKAITIGFDDTGLIAPDRKALIAAVSKVAEDVALEIKQAPAK